MRIRTTLAVGDSPSPRERPQPVQLELQPVVAGDLHELWGRDLVPGRRRPVRGASSTSNEGTSAMPSKEGTRGQWGAIGVRRAARKSSRSGGRKRGRRPRWGRMRSARGNRRAIRRTDAHETRRCPGCGVRLARSARALVHDRVRTPPAGACPRTSRIGLPVWRRLRARRGARVPPAWSAVRAAGASSRRRSRSSSSSTTGTPHGRRSPRSASRRRGDGALPRALQHHRPPRERGGVVVRGARPRRSLRRFRPVGVAVPVCQRWPAEASPAGVSAPSSSSSQRLRGKPPP